MVVAAVTIGGISTYQGMGIELRPKESDEAQEEMEEMATSIRESLKYKQTSRTTVGFFI
jgi:hypothetical protein